jgi:hypothetical protein
MSVLFFAQRGRRDESDCAKAMGHLPALLRLWQDAFDVKHVHGAHRDLQPRLYDPSLIA